MAKCFNPVTNTCPLIGIGSGSRAIGMATRSFTAVPEDLAIAGIASSCRKVLDRIVALSGNAGFGYAPAGTGEAR